MMVDFKTKQLILEGDLQVLLPGGLRIVDRHGVIRYVLRVREPARIEWESPHRHDVDAQGGELRKVREEHPDINALECSFGRINGMIDLVKPSKSVRDLYHFWKNSRDYQRATVVGLPDLSQKAEPPTYYVVTRGVAMLAYLKYGEIENLLVPALPIRKGRTLYGYEALMPMQYILESLKETSTE